MKILQVITELTPAGAERIVCELSKGLAAKGHTVCVVSLKPLPHNDAILRELKEAEIEVDSLGMGRFSLWKIGNLRKIIKRWKPDIVHSHLIHPNIIARFAKKRSSVPFKLINTVHIAERRPGKWWHFFLDRITYSLCDCQTAVSKAVRDFHSRKIEKSPELMPVIYNGIKTPKILSSQEIKKLRDEWGFDDCSKVLGSVGRLDWQKGYDQFLQLLPEISANIPENEKWGIVILGEGKQRAELERLANSAKFQKFKIILPGFRKDAADCIGAFDLFVMPSRYEGFGLTLVEAMGHGVPVLASNVDSLPELMSYYENGKCVDFSDKLKVEKGIFDLIDKPVSAPLTRFSIDKMVNEYADLYKEINH